MQKVYFTCLETPWCYTFCIDKTASGIVGRHRAMSANAKQSMRKVSRSGQANISQKTFCTLPITRAVRMVKITDIRGHEEFQMVDCTDWGGSKSGHCYDSLWLQGIFMVYRVNVCGGHWLKLKLAGNLFIRRLLGSYGQSCTTYAEQSLQEIATSATSQWCWAGCSYHYWYTRTVFSRGYPNSAMVGWLQTGPCSDSAVVKRYLPNPKGQIAVTCVDDIGSTYSINTCISAVRCSVQCTLVQRLLHRGKFHSLTCAAKIAKSLDWLHAERCGDQFVSVPAELNAAGGSWGLCSSNCDMNFDDISEDLIVRMKGWRQSLDLIYTSQSLTSSA